MRSKKSRVVLAQQRWPVDCCLVRRCIGPFAADVVVPMSGDGDGQLRRHDQSDCTVVLLLQARELWPVHPLPVCGGLIEYCLVPQIP